MDVTSDVAAKVARKVANVANMISHVGIIRHGFLLRRK